MITKDMLLGEILDKYPELAQVLMNCGMHCVSCFAAAMENLEEACLVQEYLLQYGVRIGMELQKELQDTACLLPPE